MLIANQLIVGQLKLKNAKTLLRFLLFDFPFKINQKQKKKKARGKKCVLGFRNLHRGKTRFIFLAI